MEMGSTIKDFEYVIDIHKISNDDGGDLIIVGAVSDDTTDLDNETVDQNSLRKAWETYLKNPVVRFMHDSKLGAIGRVIDEYVSADGIVHKTGYTNGIPYIVAKISSAPDLESIRIKIREGLYSGLSIGGRAKVVMKGGKRRLMIRDLIEISVVDVPSNRNSMFAVVKNACIGSECKSNENNMESETMEEKDIIEIVVKTISEIKAADDLIALQKKYDDLKKSVDTPQTEVKVDPEVDVIKTLTETVESLQSDIKEIRGVPVKKGIQDGEEPIEKAATDIASIIMARHYGGA